ncbi:MAG: translocation/assembly module TamB domain-containing protein, partial [Bacteroidota bacterium]|nr:translocation/assembly module TamB domain-containing protein [Bacteroidota bacterium]
MIYFAAVLVAIPLIALLILKSPSVQTYLTKRIADYLSFELNTVVKVGGVDVKLFKSIVLEDVYIEDQHHNELLKIGKLEANIKRIQSKKKIITFNNIKLNTLHFYLKYYHGEKETNLQFLINYFSSNDTTPSKSSWKVKCNSLYLKNTAFSYNDYTVKPSPVGIDYSNMKLTNININIKNIRTSGDTISGRIEKLSLKEKSGFIINNLSMNVRICSHYLSARNLIIKTPNTDANLNLLFSYNGYRSYQDFLKKIHISSEVKQSVVDMNDIAYFAPLLKGIDNKVLISCHYYNNNETMIAQNLELYTEQATHISGDFKVSNVTDVNKLYIQAGFKEFTTTKKDIENFHLPIVAGLKHIIIPSQVYSLGFINIKGDYSGYVNKFKANMTMTSDIGNITSDISFDYNLKTKIPSYSGKIISDKFDAGKILNYKNLGKVSMNAYLSGKYFDFNRLNMKLNGSISSVIYNGYNYKNINVNGDISKKNFTGSVKINEPNLIVDFNGDVNFNKKLPTFEFTTNIANANLSRIKLLNRDSTSNLSTLIEVNLQGNNPDNFTGEVDVSNTIYKEKGKIYKLDKFILSSEASKTERKIHLFSDFADATVQGNFQFGELINSLKSFVTRYLPSLTFKDNSTIAEIKPTKKGKKLIEKKVASPQILKYNFQFKNTSDITALFIPQLKISPNTDVAGVYNSSKNDFSLIAEASKIEFNGKTLNNWFFNSKVENNHLQLNIGCKRFSFTDSLYFDNFNILSTAAKDTLNFNCLWNSNKFRVNNRGIINGNISFKNKPELVLNLNKSTVIILDSVWNIAESRILIDSSAFMIKRLVINKKNQELNINGVISENPLSELYIDFNNFELNNFNKFLEKSGYSFEGVLNGTTNISGLYGNINFISDIKIKDFIMNNEKLGELSLLSSWDNVRNALKIKAGVTRGTIETVGIDGYYYPSSKTNNFDFNINVDKFKLYLLQQYMKSFCSNFHGFATGKLKLYGTTGEPILEGKLDLQKSGLKIDYLNTSYTFAHEVLLGRNFISFKNMVLNDTLGNEAIASGKISHNYFSDFKYEININAKKFSCLNTNSNQNSIYYGSGFITGKVNIKGNSENVYIDVNARTEKGTRVFIPLTSSEELSETNYISFIRKDSSKIVTKEKAKIDLSG